MVARLFGCGLLICCLAFAVGCNTRAESQSPEEKDKTPLANQNADKDKPPANDNDKAQVGKGGKSEDEIKLLQGSWNCVLRTIGEKELYPSQGKRTLDIRGDKYGEGMLVLDAAAKPKRLDVKLANGDDKGKTLKGIYEFRDGKLIWCFNNSHDGPRPDSFDPAKHSESIEICTFEKTRE